MIKEFQKENRWLSNFVPCTIILEGKIYSSVEHAYMSAKCTDQEWKLFCQKTKKPGQVKKASRGIKLRSNWEEIKIDIMKECLKQKYNQEPYKTKLKETGDQFIQEGNWWNDKFWGVCLKTGKGKNILGKLIMEIRKEIRRR
jgi:hypothetical protein